MHPTDAAPYLNRSNPPDPNAQVTVALDSPSIAAVYAYCGAVIQRIEFFSADNIRVEVSCPRKTWAEILHTLKADDSTLQLKSFFAQVAELDRLVALAKVAGAWQRPMEKL